ncbi:MAG: hypothetical protein SVM86_00690 [Candidatus Cloacimonadota bacterium]|nr:hypothetical protein [Candidatus Cloacimonadota bacterium]
MRRCLGILLLIALFISLKADFIIPIEDPVYDFLNIMENLKELPQTSDIYPIYHSDVINKLKKLQKAELAPSYKKLVKYHLKRLEIKSEKDTGFALYPWESLKKNFREVWQPHFHKKRLATYKKGEINLFLSGLLGIEYDIKEEDNSNYFRRRDYYGIDFGGNFYDNFGVRLTFKKGHFTGDNSFIEENPDLSIMGNNYFKDGDTYYQVDMISELDYKNKYLNLSCGYGTFKLGHSLNSSIILNSQVTPYGYVKYYKKLGNFSYTGITTQLTPDSLRNESDYKTKSMAIQTLNYANSFMSLSVGNTILYGDRTIDLAYSSPLALYKIIDNKYHGRDNIAAYVFGKFSPVKGMSFYGNLFLDDLEKERLTTKYWATSLAFQGGLEYSMKQLPLQASFELTGVGPGMYGHKSNNLEYSNLRYSHDDRLLGYEYGTNLLTFAGKMVYYNPYFSVDVIYENIQQGNLSNDPFAESEKVEFLADSINRYEKLTGKLTISYIPELNLSLEYKKDLQLSETYYIFSNIEFKY